MRIINLVIAASLGIFVVMFCNGALAQASAAAPSVSNSNFYKIDASEQAKTSQRILFISDSHACSGLESRCGTPPNDWTTKGTANIKRAVSTIKPDHINWLGDLIDFVPDEWATVASQLAWIKSNSPARVHAIMGNHDYFYYPYPEPFLSMINDLPTEITSYLTKTATVGQTILSVMDTSRFIVGHQVIMIKTPETNHLNDYQISMVTSVDHKTSRITIADPLAKKFAAKTTEIRQGTSASRGIKYFLKTFGNKDTPATRYAYTVGNNAFIMFSPDDYNPKAMRNFEWLENNIASYSKTHNVFVSMHVTPAPGASIGGIYDRGGSSCLYDKATQEKIRQLNARYPIVAWFMGHSHPNARTETVVGTGPLYGNTTFVVVPSVAISNGGEGQVLYFDLVQGATSVVLNYSVGDKVFDRAHVINLRHAVNMK